MIENLQDGLYQSGNKQAKGLKFCADIKHGLEGEKCSKTFFKVLELHNMQNQTIFELYTDDIKSKYSSNPKDILKSPKQFYEKLYTKQTSTAATTEFLSKISKRKKICNEHFNLCEGEISLDEIMKSMASKKNNKSPGNDGITAEFYKHLSNELAPVSLDVYDSWGKLGTMGVTSRTGIISAIYKKDDKKDIANYRPILLLNLDYKIYTTNS